MEFCPKCDALLVITKENGKIMLQCRDCGYVKEDMKTTKDYVISESINHNIRDKIEVLDGTEYDDSISAEIREDLTEMYREAIESFDY